MKVYFKKLSTLFLVLSVLVILGTESVSAQPTYWYNRQKSYKWMFCGGWNFVDDDGKSFENPFDIKNSWQSTSYPNFFSADRFLRKGVSFVFSGSYNYYTPGKLFNGSLGYSGHFTAVDFGFKYSFYHFLGGTFDPYAVGGLGLTYRSLYERPIISTLNIGLGLNIWFTKKIGLQVQTNIKAGVDVTNLLYTNTNYLQHTIGLVYKTQQKKPRNTFHKKRYKWTHERQRYRFKKDT